MSRVRKYCSNQRKESRGRGEKMPGKQTAARDIGIDVVPPRDRCDDKHCPFHGELSVRGQILDGTVVSTKMRQTVIVKKEHMKKLAKYERFEKRTRRMLAHSPPCLRLGVGDRVTLMECRPLSKTVSFVVIEKLEAKP